MVIVESKNVGDVKNCFREGGYVKNLEDRNEDYIKKELKIDGS